MRIPMVISLLLLSVTAVAQEGAPLLNAKYNQDYPYNLSCPDLSPTGCGPTAIAEILSYYRRPAHGFGQANLILEFDTVRVDMESLKFDWENILDSYPSGGFTELQAKSVGELMYACGVAMNVIYGSSTSVPNYAWMLWGLQHNLHISPESRYLHRSNYSTAEWIEMINFQLRERHPVFYRGTWRYADEEVGHMFAIDGLDENGNYHVNFGHGGAGDKFCDINILNQSGKCPGGRGVCYNAAQAMVINCFPTPDFYDYPLQACISEEPVILDNDVNLTSINVPLSQPFTLSCRLRNYAAEKASISFGWALMKDEEVLEILGQGRYSLSRGYTFKEASHRTIKFPNDLSDDTYKLKLYSKSDIAPEWKEVWQDSATEVDVLVAAGRATVTVPPNHLLDPCLFLEDSIIEVENDFAASAPGKAFALTITNNTINNFEQKVRLDMVLDNGEECSYETILPVYSQSSVPFHILVPSSEIDLEGREVESVRAFYYYDIEERYIEMTTENPSLWIGDNEINAQSGDILVYNISGLLLKRIKAQETMSVYNDFLSELPHGIYMIKEGTKTRKFMK